MQSIDTFYNGNYFRSRLEARWAVFFDLINCKYEYEPEGFKNGNECYLPDFYLPDTSLRGYSKLKGIYVEIKPESYKLTDVFCSNWFDKNLVLFIGFPYQNIWDTDNPCGKYGDSGYHCSLGWDNFMRIWKCKECGFTKIDYNHSNYDYCPVCQGQCDTNMLFHAGNNAQIKRFEHVKNYID